MSHLLPLKDVRILSLALNLPGPLALQRCRDMGAHCVKVEAPAPQGQATSDPMHIYSAQAYADMHAGIEVLLLNLKAPVDQERLHTELAQTDILLTSFRPAALSRLGLDWETLHALFPTLSMVRIVGAPGERANEAGHDLTYQAEAGLLRGLDMPATLAADMAGALLASEAILQVRLAALQTQSGQQMEVALSEGAKWMAKPVNWQLCASNRDLGGAHAGYRIYPCADGRIVLAALEPHFFLRLWRLVAADDTLATHPDVFDQAAGQAIASYLAPKSRAEVDTLAAAHDLPLYTLPPQ